MTVEAQFLNRGDLPDDIDFALVDLGFAVLRVRLENGTAQDWEIRAGDVQVRDPKGKSLKPAALEEITPKVMKHGRSSRRLSGVGAEVGSRYPTYPGTYPGGYPGASRPGVYTPPIGGGSGPGKVAVGEAQRIRDILAGHQLEDTTLAPGETLEALIYLKSDKPASKLRGGSVQIPPLPSVVTQ